MLTLISSLHAFDFSTVIFPIYCEGLVWGQMRSRNFRNMTKGVLQKFEKLNICFVSLLFCSLLW